MEAFGVRQGTEHDALWIANAQHAGANRFSSNRDVLFAKFLRNTHRGPERVALPFSTHQLEPLRTGVGIDQDRCAGSQILRARNQRGETTQTVAGQFRCAAIRIQQLHGGTAWPKLVHDEAVASHALMAMAHAPGQIGQIAAPTAVGHISRRDEEKVVPVGVRLGHSYGHQGSVNALKT